MIALIDCNCFFCSVEKVFHPGLTGKPVCVLSSNDGCIVALTNEAKSIGLRRGDPIFKVRDIVKRHNVQVFSSNMYLYAAMSKRITNILRSSINRVEKYSIDESFCYLDEYSKCYNIEDYMRDITLKIRQWTDIPVSVGIAPTKTIAKIGSKYAKKYQGYRSVCMIDNEEKRRKALSLFDLSDIWGIGRQTYQKLKNYGINTPLELADKPERWVKSHFTLPTLQTWKELNGIPCIETAEIIRHRTICTSRSFGEMVSDITSLRASIATFAGSCANKLRGQQSYASCVSVFVLSNRFREDLPQYCNSGKVNLTIPTSDTIEITNAAISILLQIFRPGILYKKAGVILSDIIPNDYQQLNLFDNVTNRSERYSLMRSIDTINHKYGLRSINLAVEGESTQSWHVKKDHISGNYLSDINEILTIQI